MLTLKRQGMVFGRGTVKAKDVFRFGDEILASVTNFIYMCTSGLNYVNLVAWQNARRIPIIRHLNQKHVESDTDR